MITLPHDNDRSFDLTIIIRHLQTTGRQFIIQGQQHVTLAEHTKQNSLDYFLRTNVALARDTAQATTEVIEQICDTGFFVFTRGLICPDSGRPCQGIVLTTA